MLGKDIVAEIYVTWDKTGKISTRIIKSSKKNIYEINECVAASSLMLLISQMGMLGRQDDFAGDELGWKIIETLTGKLDPLTAVGLENLSIDPILGNNATIQLLGKQQSNQTIVWHIFKTHVSIISDNERVISGVKQFVHNYVIHVLENTSGELKYRVKYWILWLIDFYFNIAPQKVHDIVYENDPIFNSKEQLLSKKSEVLYQLCRDASLSIYPSFSRIEINAELYRKLIDDFKEFQPDAGIDWEKLL